MNNHHINPYIKQITIALKNLSSALPNRDQAAAILAETLNAADPALAAKKRLTAAGNVLIAGEQSFQLKPGARIVTIALGKAAPAMMRGAAEELGALFQGGVCVCKHLDDSIKREVGTEYIIGEHPVPGEGSLRAGRRVYEALEGLTGNDLVLLLVSGGGSSLVTLPMGEVTLADLQAVTTTLLRSGATISELNTVRKHLDALKGGRLAQRAYPARVAALVLSDVIGNNLEVIASGPAYPDPSTYADALAILRRVQTFGEVPTNVTRLLEDGASGLVPETMKAGDTAAERACNTIVASNQDACAAAAAKAASLGLHAEVVTSQLTGEARLAARQIISEVKMRKDLRKPFMLVWGGETTVTVTGSGKGGRNQELALSAAIEMAGMRNISLLTFATDGEDGPTNAAGALVNGETCTRAHQLGLEPGAYLEKNDAHTFFKALGDLLITGPTGTNVNDLTFVFGD